ncbi:hypothetical protein [uncultured Alistipes sp.]|jgi:hypothetical protein|uniref:hypothetical protein n=1 Tax=uncultured Alistipes sp. TaxID=538949 RepID=UPI0025D93769|nr:hypothetical protein [uncultured Alistipes sp.]
MKQNILLPHRLKKLGWVILVPSLLLGIARLTFLDPNALFGWLGLEGQTAKFAVTSPAEQWVNTIIILGLVVGVMLVACSRERIEDEMTSQIRLRSLMSALYVYFIAVILITLFVYDISYILWMTYAMFGFTLVFLAIFQWQLWRVRKEVADEK